MLIVRFPSGVSIRYNTANFLEYKDGAWELYTGNPKMDKKAKWVASLPPTSAFVVEAMLAYSVDNPTTQLTGTRALEHVIANLRDYNGYSGHSLLRQLKAALTDYDARRGMWKE